MAGLFFLIRKGEFAKDENIIFWHTGGAAALYAYANQLMGLPVKDQPTGKLAK